MNIKKAYNFKVVNEYVTCSGTIKNVNINSLAEDGYEAVINLLPDDSEYAVKDEKKQVEHLGLQYQYIPVDWDNVNKSDYELFETVMESLKDKKIHIHCAANYRVSAFYSIYAYRNKGWSKRQAEDLMASIWNLSDYPNWNKFVASYIN